MSHIWNVLNLRSFLPFLVIFIFISIIIGQALTNLRFYILLEINMSQKEQLTSIDNFDISDVHFGEAKTSKIFLSNKIYDRIPITVRYNNGFYGPLLLKTDKCFSSGVRENYNKETGEHYGWTLPISMYDDKEPPTPYQQLFVKRFEQIIEHAKQRILNDYQMDEEAINKIGGCLWRPDDESKGSLLYAKIVCGVKGYRYYDSRFSLVKDLSRPINKVCITKEQAIEGCHVIAVIRIDSIYVSEDKAYLQVKVYEANVEKLPKLPSFI